jgi:hypothetical protein
VYLVVVPDYSGFDRESLPGLKRPAETDGLIRHHGIEAGRDQPAPDPGALHEIHAAEVHDRQVHAIVHVPEHVEVARQHAQGETTDVMRVESRTVSSQPDQERSKDEVHGATLAEATVGGQCPR